jgi:CRP-like cAMP-binding protein
MIYILRGAKNPPGKKEEKMVPIERIRNVEIFQGLGDEDLKVISPYCHEEKVPSGAVLCAEGERADRLFILEDGKVAIQFKKGVSFEIQGPGKILGWSFLVPPNRYTASAVAVAPSRLLVITSPNFYDLVHKDSRLGLKIMDNLSQVVSARLKTFVEIH